jgi:hypothetical protein
MPTPLETDTNNWSMLVDLIRSDQMTASEVQNLLEDNPEFAVWYKAQL